jgi:hypothetical protein
VLPVVPFAGAVSLGLIITYKTRTTPPLSAWLEDIEATAQNRGHDDLLVLTDTRDQWREAAADMDCQVRSVHTNRTEAVERLREDSATNDEAAPAYGPPLPPGVESERLTQTSGRLRTLLFDRPLEAYLDESEEPAFLCRAGTGGIRIVRPDGTVQDPNHVAGQGALYLLVTDRGIHYVAGVKGGDISWWFPYESLSDIEVEGRRFGENTIRFETTAGTQYEFSTHRGMRELEHAVASVQYWIDRRDGPETDDVGPVVTQELEPPGVDADLLDTTGGLIETYLAEEPLSSYLADEEESTFLFWNAKKGMRIVEPDGHERMPDNYWTFGRRFLLGTDRGLHYVAGSRSGDSSRWVPYEDIVDAGYTDWRLGVTFWFETTDGVRYEFPQWGGVDSVRQATAYATQRITEVQGERPRSSVVGGSQRRRFGRRGRRY